MLKPVRSLNFLIFNRTIVRHFHVHFSAILVYSFAGMKITMLALLLLLVGCGGSIQHPQPPQPSVIFFGDSIFGAWNLETYFPGKEYVNGGRFGYRTDQLTTILPDVLSGHKVCHGLDGDITFPLSCVSVTPPKTIVIMAAWNNFLQDDTGNPSDDLQTMALPPRALK